MLRRPVDELIGRLPIGPAAACVDLLGRYRDAGLERVLLWPMQQEVEQLHRVAEEIIPPITRNNATENGTFLG